jgi:hypothetical protein
MHPEKVDNCVELFRINFHVEEKEAGRKIGKISLLCPGPSATNRAEIISTNCVVSVNKSQISLLLSFHFFVSETVGFQ